MTILFFLLALLSVALTYNVLRPVYHHHKWIVFSFLAGWLTGTFALHVVAVQALLVFLFVWCGAVEGFWAGIGLLMFVGSWLFLVYHYFSGYKAKVLMDGIVSPHRHADDVSNWGRHRELDSSRLIRPFSDFNDTQIETLKDIVFYEVDGLRLKVDIRRPLTQTDNAPVLFQIHGGGWTHGYGSKDKQGVPLTVEMAKRGWVCVSISYRLAPRYRFPDQIVDCKRALTWVKQNIAEYGGNPDYIVATGGSAGGHLCSLLALTPNLAELQPGFESEDTTVQGCVPFYGIYDLFDSQKLQLSPALAIVMRKSIIGSTREEAPEMYRLMSPISHVNEQAPPFLVIHGDKDSLTSLGEAQYFSSELDKVSNQSVEFAEVAGAQHAFDFFASVHSDYVKLGIAERLEQWHRDYRDARAS